MHLLDALVRFGRGPSFGEQSVAVGPRVRGRSAVAVVLRVECRLDPYAAAAFFAVRLEQNPMRQPPLIELGTALAWLVAVSVVGALMVALAAAESKRPSQNMSRRPWDAVILLVVLAVFMADLPGWVGFVVAAGGLLAALARGPEAGS